MRASRSTWTQLAGFGRNWPARQERNQVPAACRGRGKSPCRGEAFPWSVGLKTLQGHMTRRKSHRDPSGKFRPERGSGVMALRMTLSRPHSATSARGNDARRTNATGRRCSNGVTPCRGAIGGPNADWRLNCCFQGRKRSGSAFRRWADITHPPRQTGSIFRSASR